MARCRDPECTFESGFWVASTVAVASACHSESRNATTSRRTLTSTSSEIACTNAVPAPQVWPNNSGAAAEASPMSLCSRSRNNTPAWLSSSMA